MVVQAHIDPTHITPRIKKATQAMLRTGMIKGGWSSKSKMLAQQLTKHADLPALTVNYWWGSKYRAPRFTASQLEYFDELFEADAAVQKITLDGGIKEYALNRINNGLRENKALVRAIVPDVCIAVQLRMDRDELREQVQNKLLELRCPKDVAALHALADSLSGTALIPVTLNL
jgi:hypothetical protein